MSEDSGNGERSADSVARVPQRSVLADEVYEILREDLIAHRIEPGARVNLDQLARQLHVSNTPVRQALARLEADGLVTKEAYRGFTASPLLDSRAVAELYDYRLMIEPVLAARAAQRNRANATSRIENMYPSEDVQRLARGPMAADAVGQKDIDFHLAIAEEAGNSFACENLRVTITRMSHYTSTLYKQTGALAATAEEHAAVASAITAGDPDAAAVAMREHLKRGLARAQLVGTP